MMWPKAISTARSRTRSLSTLYLTAGTGKWKTGGMLGAVFTLAAGGPAEVHVGTGSGGAHRLTFRGVNEKTSKVIGKNKPKNLLWSRIGVIFRYSNNRMRFFSYLCVQNLTIQK